jgi:SAM-dependent methyltransferase
MQRNDTVFAGSIPEIYDSHLVPLMFTPYADDLVSRLDGVDLNHVLETAAGTGVVTQRLAAALPDAVQIIASDLNPAMLDRAKGRPGVARVFWQQADALALPFGDGTFGAVVCQFGVMFFPDRVAGYREARRVLKPGGGFLFNAWSRLSDNPVNETVHQAIAARYHHDPPQFLPRTPFGYHDPAVIGADLRAAGFNDFSIEVVDQLSGAASAALAAIGICQGSPMRGEIEAREPGGLEAATQAATEALEARFGSGSVLAPTRALVVTARR